MPATRPLLALLLSLFLLVPAAGAGAKAHPGKRTGAFHKTKSHVKKSRRLRPNGDRDHDGLTNRFERRARTSPRKPDTDGDGILDPAEDGDVDGLPNQGEALVKMNPRRPDTDRDGILDGDENAGVVTAVTDSAVTIALAKGGDLLAVLGEDTDVLCAGMTTDHANEDDVIAYGDDDPAADDETVDESADDPFPDAEADDDFEPDAGADTRSVRLADGGCRPEVGDIVYEADIDPGVGLVVLDLLGA